jgi:hypothetical protein
MRALMHTLAKVLLPIPLLGLAACTTPQERAANVQAEVEQMMVTYGPACSKLGYASGSDAWRSCVLSLNQRDENQLYDNYPYGYGYGGWGPGRWRGGRW